MAEENDQEKTEEPSQHRIDEFRKRGDVASSRELTGVLILAASFLTLGLSVAFIFEELSKFIEWIYTLNPKEAYTANAIKTITTKSIVVAAKCCAPVMLSALCVGVIAQISQIGFLYSPEILELKFERVNPINGIKKLFSMQALMETVKGILKFIVVLWIAYVYMKEDIASYNAFMHMEVTQSYIVGKGLIGKLAFALVLGLGVVALLDFAYQKFSYRKKIMQTKEELKKESKEQDGNPEVKARIRQIQRDMSRKRMMKDIKTADVVVTNPTHISVVLKYDSENMVSPMLVGKGQDFLALKIREIAKENNIPVVENVQLARTLYKTVKVGAPVPRTLYKAVAEVLAFVYKLRKKQKALAGGLPKKISTEENRV